MNWWLPNPCIDILIVCNYTYFRQFTNFHHIDETTIRQYEVQVELENESNFYQIQFF